MTRAEKAAQWQALLRQQSDSGLSGAAFCREQNIRVKNFRWWKRRLRGTAGPELSTAPREFVELKPSRWLTGASGSGVSIHIDGCLSVQVDRDFDAATLRAVLAAVRGDAER
jgi:hypothetical protein